MILYFSATGNSGYVAKRIADGLGDERLDLFDRIRDEDFSPITSKTPLVLVTRHMPGASRELLSR